MEVCAGRSDGERVGLSPSVFVAFTRMSGSPGPDERQELKFIEGLKALGFQCSLDSEEGLPCFLLAFVNGVFLEMPSLSWPQLRTICLHHHSKIMSPPLGGETGPVSVNTLLRGKAVCAEASQGHGPHPITWTSVALWSLFPVLPASEDFRAISELWHFRFCSGC